MGKTVKIIPSVRIYGRKWDVEAWSMFKEIGDERAFNGIKSDHREHSEWQSQSGSCPSGRADNGGDHGSVQTGSQRSSESTGTVGNSKAGAGRRELYYGGSGYLADRTLIHTF